MGMGSIAGRHSFPYQLFNVIYQLQVRNNSEFLKYRRYISFEPIFVGFKTRQKVAH
jgi:hypothetical protein